eukprot:XP_023985138.1 lymphocyte antigen 6H-like [Physeter catodon]
MDVLLCGSLNPAFLPSEPGPVSLPSPSPEPVVLHLFWHQRCRQSQPVPAHPINGSPAVCFRGDLTTAMGSGKVEPYYTDCAISCCALSCETASTAMPVLAASMTPKTEVRGVTCCAKDLCDGVAPTGRSLWALAAGLLLSVRPTFLWALL